jgi:hypothetical protein
MMFPKFVEYELWACERIGICSLSIYEDWGEILSYLVRLDGRPRSASGLGLLSKNVKYLLCTIPQIANSQKACN